MNERELAEAMRKLAAENAATPVPPEIEARVMVAFDGGSRWLRQRWPRPWRWPSG